MRWLFWLLAVFAAAVTVVVRKVEAPEPPLLPPQQAWFLRENLKLRLLNARLALLTRDEAGYREDLRVAQTWIQRYFDAQAKGSLAALAQLRQLSAASWWCAR